MQDNTVKIIHFALRGKSEFEEEREVYPRILQNTNTGTKKIKLSEVHNALDEQLSKYIWMMKCHLTSGKHDNIACFVGLR